MTDNNRSFNLIPVETGMTPDEAAQHAIPLHGFVAFPMIAIEEDEGAYPATIFMFRFRLDGDDDDGVAAFSMPTEGVPLLINMLEGCVLQAQDPIE